MAKKKQEKSSASKPLTNIATIWAAIGSAVALIGAGFGVGCYYKEISHKIEINELNNKYQNGFASQKEEYDNAIFELKHQNQLLEIQNAKLSE